jgi:hypothetical protein
VPVFRFDTLQRHPSLRCSTARVMTADCLGYHNQDPNRTRRDGRIGDVRGVIEIIRLLDRDIALAHEGLRGTFLLMAVVSGALLSLSALVLVARSRRPA